MTATTKKPHALIDALMKDQKMTSDRALCIALKFDPAVICNIRKLGRVSDEFRVAVMRRFRWSLKRLDALAPPAERGQ